MVITLLLLIFHSDKIKFGANIFSTRETEQTVFIYVIFKIIQRFS